MIAIKNMKNIPKSCILCDLVKHGGCCYYKNPPYELSSYNILDERPSDCPLVEIITCKDCKHGTKLNGYNYYLCDRFTSTHASFLGFSSDYYCADAERKEK